VAALLSSSPPPSQCLVVPRQWKGAQCLLVQRQASLQWESGRRKVVAKAVPQEYVQVESC